MKNPILIVSILIVLAVLGTGAFALSQESSQSESMVKTNEALLPQGETIVNSTDSMMKKDESMMQKNDEATMGNKSMSSRYITYSNGALDQPFTTRRVLFFYASWCPTCKEADADFKVNANEIPEDVALIRVNYNDPETDQEEKDLAKKYFVTYQHTYVQIDDTGKEITKWNGGQFDELLKNIK